MLYLTGAPELIYRRVFEPYGGVAAESVGTALHEHIFTGKREDADTRVGSESGLIHFGARWYDAEIGRFLSIDPIVQTLDDPQTHNPYGYVRNNPLNHVDPDGREWFRWVSALGFMVMSAGAVALSPAFLSAGATLLSLGQGAAGNGTAALVFGILGAGLAPISGPSGGMIPFATGLAAAASEGAGLSALGILGSLITSSAAITSAAGDLDSAAEGQEKGSGARSEAAGYAIPWPIIIGQADGPWPGPVDLIAWSIWLLVLSIDLSRDRTTPDTATKRWHKRDGPYLVRFGEPKDAAGLEDEATRAEAAGYPHGVSTFLFSSVPPSVIRRGGSVARLSDVQRGFGVRQTGANPGHHTVILPKPVTHETAARFNALFSR